MTEQDKTRRELASRYLEKMLDTPGSKSDKVRAAFEYADLVIKKGNDSTSVKEPENVESL
jgi:hypothetical protein|tara:strand:+ start:432 stop:611 length:180 start_codon:yes stop_codon:yes gene_type:complete